MAKRLVISLCLVVVMGIVWFLWSIQSQDISVELQGTKYRLGENHTHFFQPVTVKIKGNVHRSLLGDRKFRGTIELEGENVPVPADQREISITLPKDEPGLLIYSDTEDGKTRFYHVGGLFVNSDFSKVAFYLNERTTNDSSDGGSWSGDNGLMLAAPASNREQALAVSKELMKKWMFAHTCPGNKGGNAPCSIKRQPSD